MLHKYALEPDEITRFTEWNNKHKEICVYTPKEENLFVEGAIGGRLTFSFTPTSLGTFVSVICACGEIASLTDCSEW